MIYTFTHLFLHVSRVSQVLFIRVIRVIRGYCNPTNTFMNSLIR